MITSSHPSLTNAFTWVLLVTTALAIPARLLGVSAEQALLGLALIAGLVLLSVSAELRTEVRGLVTSTPGKLISAVFVAWAVVIPFSFNVAESFEIAARTGVFVAGAALIGAVIKLSEEKQDLLLKIFMSAALIFIVLGLVTVDGHTEFLAFLKGKALEDVHQIKVVKPYTTASLCMIPVMVFAGRHLGGKWQWAGYAYVPLVCALMFLSITRSAMAGLMMMGMTFLLMTAIAKRFYIKTALSTIVVGVAGLMYWIRQDRYVYEYFHSDMTYLPGWLVDPHRQSIWSFVFDRFMEHPLVGNGIDQLNKLPGAHEVVSGLGSRAHVVPSHPHNFAVEILGETGLIGFIPVIVVLLYFTWTLSKAVLGRYDEKALAQLLLFVAFWTCSLFSYSIWAVWWQLVLFVLFALLWALPGRRAGQ